MTNSNDVKVLNQAHGKDWSLYHADCVEGIRGIPDDSLHYVVTSPPFANLYTYSPSNRDMGNSKDDREFFIHFQYLVKELYRAIMPGRLVSLHCMNLPSTLQHNGYIGIRDFRGDLIRAFINDEAAEFYSAIDKLKVRVDQANVNGEVERAYRLLESIRNMEEELYSYPGDGGFIFHSEVTIWKDPVTAMQRTKAIGLLHKQVVKDSAMSRQGIPDYLVTFRKPGTNPEPVSGEFQYFAGENPPPKSGDKTRDSINIWQRYASPVWMDINPNNTLQYQSARDNNDERHICPLQIDVIERGLQLWTNPGDTVLDPYNGIGSTGYVAIKNNRKYVGFELKESYYKAAANNLKNAEIAKSQDLLSLLNM